MFGALGLWRGEYQQNMINPDSLHTGKTTERPQTVWCQRHSTLAALRRISHSCSSFCSFSIWSSCSKNFVDIRALLVIVILLPTGGGGTASTQKKEGAIQDYRSVQEKSTLDFLCEPIIISIFRGS